MNLISRLRSNALRALLLLLASVYLMFSVGVLKATHFCMGRAASVTFFSADSKACACSLFASEKDSCCDDQNEIIKIDDDHKDITTYTIRVPHLYLLEDLYTERLITLLREETQKRNFEQDTFPPPVPLFKANCSFVFYDSEIRS